MDITAVFGTVILGSSPGGGTKNVSRTRIFVLPQRANGFARVMARTKNRYTRREKRVLVGFSRDRETIFL